MGVIVILRLRDTKLKRNLFKQWGGGRSVSCGMQILPISNDQDP
jgi:hypothetical protein